MKEKPYNFEDRLVEFAGETILFCKTLPKDDTGRYYHNQLMRSSGSAALNFGEAQGTITTNDFIHKTSIVLKEIKESKVSLKILDYVKYGNQSKREELLQESKELELISARMILNKKHQKNTLVPK